jgi:uncharacterized protein (TIGR03084 family)
MEQHLTRKPEQLYTDWAERRKLLLETLRGATPAERLPWFGPSMSLASMISARLMETWAHGQGISDTFGVDVAPTDRIRHVVYIVRACAYRLPSTG